jgi:uncharacterized protein (TIGR03435 family)
MKTADKYTGVRAGPSAVGTRLEGKATTAFLAQQLAMGAGRIVFDRTDLRGNYEFKLEWTPDGAEPADGSPSLSIFTAVQEQLGLKQSSKAPLETIVIEHAEMPAEN